MDETLAIDRKHYGLWVVSMSDTTLCDIHYHKESSCRKATRFGLRYVILQHYLLRHVSVPAAKVDD